MEASTQVKAMAPSDQNELLAGEEADAAADEVESADPALDTSSHAVDAPLAAIDFASNYEEAWRAAEALYGADEIIEADVTGFNKGGLLVSWRGLQGFVPASQLLYLTQLHIEEERLRQLQERQGETLALKIIEVDRSANRLIFSERATEVSASDRERLLQELKEGDIRVGVVTNLAKFGAFIDLGGVEGLIHISQLSWRRLNHPSDVVQPGQRIRVLVMEVDVERGRVALSRKLLRTDPWIKVEERYCPGQIVAGTVSNVADFGIFVLLEEGLEGLIHISEMGDGAYAPPGHLLQKGDKVQARVLNVSESERRLALSLRLLHDVDDQA